LKFRSAASLASRPRGSHHSGGQSQPQCTLRCGRSRGNEHPPSGQRTPLATHTLPPRECAGRDSAAPPSARTALHTFRCPHVPLPPQAQRTDRTRDSKDRLQDSRPREDEGRQRRSRGCRGTQKSNTLLNRSKKNENKKRNRPLPACPRAFRPALREPRQSRRSVLLMYHHESPAMGQLATMMLLV